MHLSLLFWERNANNLAFIFIMLKNIKFIKLFYLFLYYAVAQYLPNSYLPYIGYLPNKFRCWLVKKIAYKAGRISTINRRVNFGSGRMLCIGDYSGIGANVKIPNNTIIGSNVIIGRNTFILNRNHEFSRIDIPIVKQGFRESRQTIIEDDVWIGMNCFMTPGRLVKRGSIIAAGCVLCKDFPEYSIVGGNPSKLIKYRNS